MPSVPQFQQGVYNRRDGAPNNVAHTPKSHNEINDIVESLAIQYHLPLKRRDSHFSPSDYYASDSDSCYNAIRILYYKDRPALHEAIFHFKDSVDIHSDTDHRLQCLKEWLHNANWLVRERISPVKDRLKAAEVADRPRQSANERPSHLAHPPVQDHHFQDLSPLPNNVRMCFRNPELSLSKLYEPS